MLIKRKWVRGVLYTVSGLLLGHWAFKEMPENHKRVALIGGVATLAPLVIQQPNHEPIKKESTTD